MRRIEVFTFVDLCSVGTFCGTVATSGQLSRPTADGYALAIVGLVLFWLYCLILVKVLI